MTEARYLVGIDLGTTHTVVAYADLAGDRSPRIFAIEQLIAPGEVAPRPLLPSVRYCPLEGELTEPETRLPWSAGEDPSAQNAPHVVGEFAALLGAKTPGRLITSAKSWLSHPSIDRTAPILPWGAPAGVPKVSAVAASASYLAHLRAAWDHSHPRDPLAAQEIVLTIPASFDEGARALTVAAANAAGLPRIKLLEEPQAAFYDWLGRRGQAALEEADVRLALVVDVGGGTTDLTLIRVERRDGALRISRIAVGDHLMLGGDNMDLSIAHVLERKLDSGKLPGGKFAQLVQASRAAKERLLSDESAASTQVSIVGGGSKLVASTISLELLRNDIDDVVLEGFFPMVDAESRPTRRGSAIVELGLPYVSDPAVSRHLAAFLARHREVASEALGDRAPADAARVAAPDAVLLNGGVFRSPALARRMIEQVARFRDGQAPTRLDNTEPELAVARGAVFFALARRGVGAKIVGGSARSYFLLLPKTDEGERQRGVCLLPRGAEEGEEVTLESRSFSLKLGQPVRFHLASSTAEATYVRAGELVELDPELIRELPPLAAVLEHGEGGAKELLVKLTASLTEIGTLELHAFSPDAPSRRWKLELMLRGAEEGSGARAIAQMHPRFREAKAKIDAVYGRSDAPSGKPQKTLRSDLEKLLGPRDTWTPPLLRELWSALFAGHKRRRRSDDHERVFFNLTGYCLRPGFGVPLDDWRVKETFERLFSSGVQFAPEAQNWSEWWTLWRRVAGGLDARMQSQVLQSFEWYLRPPSSRPRNRPAGPKAQAEGEMIRLAASLERISSADKARVGDWLIERLLEHDEKPAAWWAVGRIGARVPFYGSAHDVVSPSAAQKWLSVLMKLDWTTIEPAAFAAAQLARRSGDRIRDLDDSVRESVALRLEREKSPPSFVRMVREVAELPSSEEGKAFGESLPPGLRLVE